MTTSNLSEDGSFTIPESSQTVFGGTKMYYSKEEAPGEGLRIESRKIFHIHCQKNTPSTPYLVVEDAEALLKSTNCYSSGKKIKQGVASSPPEIPKIVVTCDKHKSQEEEIRKKLAVAKIKEAIHTSMSSTEDVSSNPILGNASLHCSESPTTPNSQRRHSAVYENRRKHSEDIPLSGRRGSGPNLRRTHSAKLGKPRPMIWEHFDEVPGNSTIGKCKECHMAVSCKYNTGQFVRHLQNSHKEVYRRYQSKIDSAWAKSVIEKNLK
ncbi:unnamed protein product [Lepeophtheirus salmonis]|uniref:(salmon louse) hypothetical protein n=1 Tax=Lepeophtheirus salmonis TaxID=72036 RepID=A0A7R8D2J6_LEPSM|nr:unnamed protein product [Lepeophtheirus salmonis]CAF2976986.1 unnamed protein product [Lepeophtheirus salmonis]